MANNLKLDNEHCIYISSKGDDSYPGTREKPVRNTDRALELAFAKGVTGICYLDSGDYESVQGKEYWQYETHN